MLSVGVIGRRMYLLHETKRFTQKVQSNEPYELSKLNQRFFFDDLLKSSPDGEDAQSDA